MGNILKIVAGTLLLLLAAFLGWRQQIPGLAAATVHWWSLLGAMLGGLLLGHGLRGFGVQHREQTQAQFFQGKVDAAIRESDERNLRMKMLDARVATLEPLAIQLRDRERKYQETSAELERLRSLPATVIEKIIEVTKTVEVGKGVAGEKAEAPAMALASAPTPAVATSPAPAPAMAAVPAPASWPHPVEADNLELIHGVGPKLARFLNSRGITLFSQVAEWKPVDIERLEAELPQFRGRIRREGWVGSAAAEHRKKYGSVWTGAS